MVVVVVVVVVVAVVPIVAGVRYLILQRLNQSKARKWRRGSSPAMKSTKKFAHRRRNWWW